MENVPQCLQAAWGRLKDLADLADLAYTSMEDELTEQEFQRRVDLAIPDIRDAAGHPELTLKSMADFLRAFMANSQPTHLTFVFHHEVLRALVETTTQDLMDRRRLLMCLALCFIGLYGTKTAWQADDGWRANRGIFVMLMSLTSEYERVMQQERERPLRQDRYFLWRQLPLDMALSAWGVEMTRRCLCALLRFSPSQTNTNQYQHLHLLNLNTVFHNMRQAAEKAARPSSSSA